MGLLTEVWARDIKEKLFPDDSHVMQSFSDDMWVNNKTVNRPQSGVLPVAVINRASYPGTLIRRSDAINSYSMDEVTTDPTHIPDIEEVEVSYPKRQSVLKGHIDVLNLTIANQITYRWAPSGASNILRTTGGNITANTPGATGLRKKLTLSDLFKAKTSFDDMEIPTGDRYILLPASIYNQLTEDEKTILVSSDFKSDATIKDGMYTKILGFNIFIRGRENVLRYNNAGTPVAITPQTAGAATDNAAILCWHKDFVAKARGAVKVFSNIDDPTLYGSAFSALARCGGQKVYTDQRGVLAIVEAVGV